MSMGLFVSIFLTAMLMPGATPPPAPKKPIQHVYHGVTVTDDYEWLEDSSRPEVRAWSDAQNASARQVLDGLPGRKALETELRKIMSDPSPSYFGLTVARGTIFAMKRQPPKQQPLLVALKSVDTAGEDRLVLDPTTLHAAIDFFEPSKDGKLLAISVSRGGSESGDVLVYDAATGKALSDVVPRVNGGTAGGSVAWNGDGTGFWYTRYPRGKERAPADMDFYQQIWFHKIGTPTEQDTYCAGKDFPRVAEIVLESSADGRAVLARVANGDGGEFAHYLWTAGKDWVRFAGYADQVVEARFGGNQVFLLSRNRAPLGKILRLTLTNPAIGSAVQVVPEGKLSIDHFQATATRLFVKDLDGGPSRLRVFDISGHAQGEVQLPPIANVSEMTTAGDDLLYSVNTYLQPRAWYRYSAASRQARKTALGETSPVSTADLEVVREFAVSKDGTRVPLNIIRKKGLALDGSHPTLLNAYGGYSVSLGPAFTAQLRPLFDRGFVYAVANLRGGGEYGEQWHLAGNLTRKQNVFDDFAAAAKHLIDKGYTKPARLAIQGGSNGGLLMGAALTQHPELFGAVVSHVGIYDMLRVELSPNGAFNITEFGTVKEPDHFRALYAYSPYHHVVDGKQYPAILFLTGANDPRVDPMHSRKMTARLQAAGAKRPVLLRTSGNTGHGAGTPLDERIAQAVDVYSFLCAELGVH
jgi:prolyl oligopeptidase